MSVVTGMEDGMDQIDELLRKLGPVLKDKAKARRILVRYWRHQIALIWKTQDLHRAANELCVALTEREAMHVLETLHRQHNRQLGLRWEDLTGHIEAHVLGRKLTKREVNEFVKNNRLTIQR